MNKKNIIWLTSYPKSGNTWFRVFLTNLNNDLDTPANINDLAETTIASSRKIFDDYTGLSSADLTFEEIDKLRPDVYRLQSEESNELLFKKVHDKFYFVDKDQPLFPPEVSKGVIYLIRNPLDVLVSFAYHSAKPVDKMIKSFNNSTNAFCDRDDMLTNQLRQQLGSWSDHIKSWTEQDLIPVHVLRYEDMVNDTFNSFNAAVKYLGIEKSDKEIENAIEFSSFSILSVQEEKEGFKEKMIKSKSFFRKGKIGDWRNHLTDEIVNLVIEKHEDAMREYGYLNEGNDLKY